jgi:hypothetical protein
MSIKHGGVLMFTACCLHYSDFSISVHLFHFHNWVCCVFQVDHEAHGSTTSDQYCVTLRRYAGMALTNLTFGDGANKALLCSFRQFMKALVAQLKSPSEDLRQVIVNNNRNMETIVVGRQ